MRNARLNIWRHGWNAVTISDIVFLRDPNDHLVADTPGTLDDEGMDHAVSGTSAALTGM